LLPYIPHREKIKKGAYLFFPLNVYYSISFQALQLTSSHGNHTGTVGTDNSNVKVRSGGVSYSGMMLVSNFMKISHLWKQIY
jgi:hypothetical protein